MYVFCAVWKDKRLIAAMKIFISMRRGIPACPCLDPRASLPGTDMHMRLHSGYILVFLYTYLGS